MKITLEVIGVDRTLQSLEQEIRQFQTFLTDTFKNEVVPRTPIDKGRARAGWQSRTNTLVENRVPYIERLERGYSRQAPKGFVNQAISATIQKSKRIIK